MKKMTRTIVGVAPSRTERDAFLFVEKMTFS